jgi:hypothetical protein
MNARTFLPCLLGALLVLGCDDKKKSEGSGDKSSESKKDDDKDDKKDDKKGSKKGDKAKGDDDDDKSAKKPKGDKADKGSGEKVELADLDLSTRGPAWKGWTIKAPKDAKVMEDMSDLRVAGKGCSIVEDCPYFDLILSEKKPDLKAFKASQAKAAADLKDKIEWGEETAESLEWTRETLGVKTRNFRRIVKVGTKEIGCWPFGGVTKESDFSALKEACKSVSKK